MLYAQRDEDGNIVALFSSPRDDTLYPVSAHDPEVLQFVQENESGEISREFLSTTDANLVRVVEDLIELLVTKNLIMITELPDAVQRKLDIRRFARATLREDPNPMVDQEDIL